MTGAPPSDVNAEQATSDAPEPIALSALQHILFCPRQFALIHVEGVWRENALTAAGRVLHERVDKPVGETRRDVHLATSLRLASQRWGLVGVADLVEFHRVESATDGDGVRVASQIEGRDGWWRPVPVEYKRGRPKSHRADEVQLCAQALCLEEMLNVSIAKGFLFYGETRRRLEVAFDEGLRDLTVGASRQARELLVSGTIPAAVRRKGCEACSLKDVCGPDAGHASVAGWIEAQIDGHVA